MTPSQTVPQPIGCVVIVFSADGSQVLVGKRKNSYAAGKHGFPGGRVELGEQLADCARRELLEETGLIAEELRYVGVVKEAQLERYFVHFVFECRQFSGVLETKEPEKCEGWEWQRLEDVRDQKILLRGHSMALELFLTEKSLIEG